MLPSEQTSHGARQDFPEVTRTGDGGDVEVDRTEVDHKTQQIKVQRPEVQRQNVACWGFRGATDDVERGPELVEELRRRPPP